VSGVRRASTVAGLRAAAAGGAPLTRAIEEGNPPSRELPPRPAKPIRFTLDLDRDDHQMLKRFAVSIEADASQVMRALLDQLRDDPDLARRVREAIWQS